MSLVDVTISVPEKRYIVSLGRNWKRWYHALVPGEVGVGDVPAGEHVNYVEKGDAGGSE